MTSIASIRLLALTAVLAIGCDASPSSAIRPFDPAPATGGVSASGGSAKPAVRKFAFTYASTIVDLPPGRVARVWVPLATDSHEQRVTLKSISVPGEYRRTRERRFGNELAYFEAAADSAGRVSLEIEYEIERREARLADAEPRQGDVPAALSEASRLVPVDGTLQRRLFGDEEIVGDRLSVARRVYDGVGRRMRYGKPEGLPWGRGDAVWACDSGVGNCSDFHSLFIGAVRDLGIPARFEIGFSIPREMESGEVAGYHCWARFLIADETSGDSEQDAAGGRWVPVDITEAEKYPESRDYYFGNLTADRVLFTIGRDLELEPSQEAGPVNFLVYPYVEVDGRQHTAMTHRFTYADLR